MDGFGLGLLRLTNPAMDVFDLIRKKGSGGSAILVRRDWNARLAFSHPEGQATSIEIVRQGCRMIVISVYAPNVREELPMVLDYGEHARE
eukprot:c30794_g1_i1 orf=204-473(+)